MNARRVLALGLGSLLLSASAAVSSAAWADDPTPAPSATSVEAVSCEASTPAPDGSWSQKCSDGSSYVYNADGSWVNTLAGGCVVSGDAEGNIKREGDCPDETPIGAGGGGCFQQTDGNGNVVLDDAGNPLVACADGVACSADGPDVACPMMYSSGIAGGTPGRENCPQCRNFSGGVDVAAAKADDATGINAERLAKDAAKAEAALTPTDKAAAIEAAGGNQPAVALPGTGQSKGAGPVAPIAATVLGGGMLAAGVSIWRGRLKATA